jgi:hypothetical protein
MAQAFSFGGGLKNGGLSEEAMEILNPIMRFDYMGSAEFEFGALPEALNKMLQTGFSRFLIKDVEAENKKADLHLFCNLEIKEEMESRLRAIAKDKLDLKEPARINKMIEAYGDPEGTHPRFVEDLIGGIELDNGAIYFIHQESADAFEGILEES